VYYCVVVCVVIVLLFWCCGKKRHTTVMSSLMPPLLPTSLLPTCHTYTYTRPTPHYLRRRATPHTEAALHIYGDCSTYRGRGWRIASAALLCSLQRLSAHSFLLPPPLQHFSFSASLSPLLCHFTALTSLLPGLPRQRRAKERDRRDGLARTACATAGRLLWTTANSTRISRHLCRP